MICLVVIVVVVLFLGIFVSGSGSGKLLIVWWHPPGPCLGEDAVSVLLQLHH